MFPLVIPGCRDLFNLNTTSMVEEDLIKRRIRVTRIQSNRFHTAIGKLENYLLLPSASGSLPLSTYSLDLEVGPAGAKFSLWNRTNMFMFTATSTVSQIALQDSMSGMIYTKPFINFIHFSPANMSLSHLWNQLLVRSAKVNHLFITLYIFENMSIHTTWVHGHKIKSSIWKGRLSFLFLKALAQNTALSWQLEYNP